MELHNSDYHSLGLGAKVMSTSDSVLYNTGTGSIPSVKHSSVFRLQNLRFSGFYDSTASLLMYGNVKICDITVYSSLLLCERQSRYLHVSCAPPEICMMPEDCRPPPARHPAGVTFTAPPVFFFRGPATYASDTLTTTAPLHVCFAVSILEINELVLEM